MVRKCNVVDSDACMCRNLICFIVFLVIGLLLLIGGGVITAIGFGTWPVDNFDYSNLSKRVAGLILAVAGVLPIIFAVCCFLFYIAHKRGKLPDMEKRRDPTASVPMKSSAWGGQEKSLPVDMVSYLPEGGSGRGGVYTVQINNEDSLYKGSGGAGGDHDDSFASVPLSYNHVTSVSNDYKYPTADYTEPRYSDTDVNRPPSKKSVQDDAVLATGAFCENQVDSIEKVTHRTKHTTRATEEQHLHRGQDDEELRDDSEASRPKNKKKNKKRKPANDGSHPGNMYDDVEHGEQPSRYGQMSDNDVEFSPEEELAPPSSRSSKQHRNY